MIPNDREERPPRRSRCHFPDTRRAVERSSNPRSWCRRSAVELRRSGSGAIAIRGVACKLTRVWEISCVRTSLQVRVVACSIRRRNPTQSRPRRRSRRGSNLQCAAGNFSSAVRPLRDRRAAAARLLLHCFSTAAARYGRGSGVPARPSEVLRLGSTAGTAVRTVARLYRPTRPTPSVWKHNSLVPGWMGAPLS